MDAELKNLRIDRTARREPGASRWVIRVLVLVIILLLAAGAWRVYSAKMEDAIPEVQTERVRAISAASAPEGVVLNATGYIVAAHRIEVAAKVVGKVKWIGVDKGDHVREGDVMVRLEDDEYEAQMEQARGSLATLQAKMDEALHGSRPEEIAQAEANLDSSKADMANAKVSLDRVKSQLDEGLVAKQIVDDAQARYDSAVHKVGSLQKAYELVRLGPRKEEIDSLRGQLQQARGALDYARTNLQNTVIRAPVTGTILERAVERGEFVTTSFVGDRGAKGYVVSLADLNDLQVELDISQNDFAKLHGEQNGVITTDAFPDRKYSGFINEISPEANRQKATVQVKVKIVSPDEYLRPEMNASVSFLADPAPQKEATESATPPKPVVIVPSTAVRDGGVFVMLDGKAVHRGVKTGPTSGTGVRIEEGLIGGEDLIVSPPVGLKDGDKVRRKA